MYHLLDWITERIARYLALISGGVLLILIMLTCISIIGRTFVPLGIGIGPIRGIYDISEISMAAAVFGFLPWAQYKDSHARVDLFQFAIPQTMERILDILFNLAMTLVAVVGTWRLYLGMTDKYRFGETTLIAEIPVWIGYAAGMVGACGFVFVSAFCVIRSIRRLIVTEEEAPS